MKAKHVIVWRFKDAPKVLRDVSRSGGNEDWLVEVSSAWINEDYAIPDWMYALDYIREPKTYRHPTRKGWAVITGRHE